MESRAHKIAVSMGLGTLLGMWLINKTLPPPFWLVGAFAGAVSGVLIAFVSEIIPQIIPALKETWHSLVSLPQVWSTIERSYHEFREASTLERWQKLARIGFFTIIAEVLLVVILTGVLNDTSTHSLHTSIWAVTLMFVMIVPYYIVSLKFVLEGASQIQSWEYHSTLEQEELEQKKLAAARLGVLLAIPVVGYGFFLWIATRWIGVRLPGFLWRTILFFGDLITAVPRFVIALISRVYSSMMLVMLFWGVVGIIVSQKLFVETLNLETAQYLFAGFVLGCLNGYFQVVIISRKFLHLQTIKIF